MKSFHFVFLAQPTHNKPTIVISSKQSLLYFLKIFIKIFFFLPSQQNTNVSSSSPLPGPLERKEPFMQCQSSLNSTRGEQLTLSPLKSLHFLPFCFGADKVVLVSKRNRRGNPKVLISAMPWPTQCLGFSFGICLFCSFVFKHYPHKTQILLFTS